MNQTEQQAKMDELKREVDDNRVEEYRSAQYGKALGLRIAKGYRRHPDIVLSNLLTSFEAHMDEGSDIDKSECAQLYLEWAVDRYMGAHIDRIANQFNKVWMDLRTHGVRTKSNAIVIGDMDNSIWAEQAGDKRAILIECHCAARDDNIRIYVQDKPLSSGDSEIFSTIFRTRGLHIRNLQRRKRNHCKSMTLNQFRKKKFEPRYGDSRDEGYVASMHRLGNKTDNAISSYHEIAATLSQWRFAIPESYDCPYEAPDEWLEFIKSKNVIT